VVEHVIFDEPILLDLDRPRATGELGHEVDANSRQLEGRTAVDSSVAPLPVQATGPRQDVG
jgi:hypothetical protein